MHEGVAFLPERRAPSWSSRTKPALYWNIGFKMLMRLLAVFFAVAIARANQAGLISSVRLDLDDCDDIATDSHSFYLACHSTHMPGIAAATPPDMDAYAARVDRRSGKLLYLVRLGGKGLDIANRIMLDRRGFAYVTGFTASRDFPISADALQKTYGGGDTDVFLTVIDPNGQITYSTYFGGTQADQGDGIAWARNGDVLIAGSTWSPDFPYVVASFGPRGKGDAFVARLKPGVATVHRAVVIGGSGAEKLTGIASAGGGIFLTGYTESPDFPAEHALQSRLSGTSDAFLAALPEGLESITFSTFLGGSGADSSWGVALDRRGNPILAGITDSDDLSTTAAAPQRRRAGKSDAFVMKISRTGQRLQFSSYYGGAGLDNAGYDGQNLAVSRRGSIYVVGLTNSRDLVVPGAYHSNYGGGEQDGFLVAFSPKGKLCYASYAGGTARYLLEGIAFADSEKVVYAVGTAIRPIEPDSPKPDASEKYGTFVIALEAPRGCR
jgi:hypothetical protein